MRQITAIVLITFGLGLSESAFAIKPNWTPASIRARIDKLFHRKNPDTFGKSGRLNQQKSLKEKKETLISYFITLSKIQGNGSTPFHKETFGGPVDGNLYVDYILKGLDEIKLSARPKTYAYTAPPKWYQKGYSLRLSKDFFQSRSRVIPLKTLIHEAHHINEGKPHIPCPDTQKVVLGLDTAAKRHTTIGSYQINSKDSLVKKRGCDKSKKGAYGVEFVFLRNLYLHCTNCKKHGLDQETLVKSWRQALLRVVSHKSRWQLKADASTAENLAAMALQKESQLGYEYDLKAALKSPDISKTVIQMAPRYFHELSIKWLERLLKKGANINGQTPYATTSPIFNAVANCYLHGWPLPLTEDKAPQCKRISELVKRGADLTIKNRQGKTLDQYIASSSLFPKKFTSYVREQIQQAR